MAANHEIKLLEKCRVAPPPDTTTVAELTLPLTFYDLQFLVNPPSQFVHFYRFRHSSPTSPQFIISSLKSSLSIVLKHFLPLAGNLICPIDDDHRIPELRYRKGDSVSLTIAESSEDFDYFVGDHQKDSYKFHSLVPQLPEPFVTSGSQISSVFALQVTVFPNFGLSIGRTVFHLLGDATTFINFIKLWASIYKLNGDSLDLLQSSFEPLHDRSVVQDPFHLGRKIFNDIKLVLRSHVIIPTRVSNPTNSKGEVRSTFILHRCDIMKLKSFVGNNNVSTFSITCALMWTCLSKSLDVVGQGKGKVEEDKHENVCAFINFRQRFDPPIPQNYFGNCIVPCIAGLTHGQLVGNEGLSVAATVIGGAIQKMAHDSEGILRGDWLPYSHTTRTPGLAPGMLVIVGSTQQTVYNHNADYSWGELVKYECVSINASAILMLIALSRRFEGALEISFSLPKKRMDAFTTIFTNFIHTVNLRSPL